VSGGQKRAGTLAPAKGGYFIHDQPIIYQIGAVYCSLTAIYIFLRNPDASSVFPPCSSM